MTMKRIIRSLAVVLVLASLCAFTACNNNGGSAGESGSEESVLKTDDRLYGKWQSEKKSNYVYTFNADGTGQYDMGGNVLELTYTNEDGKITLSFIQEGYTPVTLSYELDGDRLNIKDSYGKDTFYIRVKE